MKWHQNSEYHSFFIKELQVTGQRTTEWFLVLDIKLSLNGLKLNQKLNINFFPFFFSNALNGISPASVNGNNWSWIGTERTGNQNWITVHESMCFICTSQARPQVSISRPASMVFDKQWKTNSFRRCIPLIVLRPQDCYAVYPKLGPIKYLYQCFKDVSSATLVIINCSRLE